MNKIILAGGTGFLGNVIIDFFPKNDYEFIILTRQPNKIKLESNCKAVYWDGKTVGDWSKTLEGAKAIINLAGKSVNCRYTEINKQQILTSRIDATNAIGNAILACKNPPEIWMNAASATIYRYSETVDMDESVTDYNDDYSVSVCLAWEKCFNQFKTLSTRKIALRISLVMDKNEGVFPRLKKLVQFGLGGKQGNGKQMVSWIYTEDFCRAIDFFIQNKNSNGAYNLCSPFPISNELMMKTIRDKMKFPFGLPAYEWQLKIGAILIGTETELILKSRRVVPTRLLTGGFKFKFEKFDEAISKMLS